METDKREAIESLLRQTDELGGKVEASGLSWISPQVDDLTREIYAHLHEIVALLERIGGEE